MPANLYVRKMTVSDGVYSANETTITKTQLITVLLRSYTKSFSFPQGCRDGDTKMYEGL